MEGATFSGKLCAQAIAEDWNTSSVLPSQAAKQPAMA